MSKYLFVLILLLSSVSVFSKSKSQNNGSASCPCQHNDNHKIDYYVVDGVLLEADDQQPPKQTSSYSLTSINSKDIKEAEIVKYADTNCNCVYIFFIRTKKGKKLKKQIPETLSELSNKGIIAR